jgi:hypothetical protein
LQILPGDRLAVWSNSWGKDGYTMRRTLRTHRCPPLPCPPIPSFIVRLRDKRRKTASKRDLRFCLRGLIGISVSRCRTMLKIWRRRILASWGCEDDRWTSQFPLLPRQDSSCSDTIVSVRPSNPLAHTNRCARGCYVWHHLR